jgi:hypothetical protein
VGCRLHGVGSEDVVDRLIDRCRLDALRRDQVETRARDVDTTPNCDEGQQSGLTSLCVIEFIHICEHMLRLYLRFGSPRARDVCFHSTCSFRRFRGPPSMRSFQRGETLTRVRRKIVRMTATECHWSKHPPRQDYKLCRGQQY